MRGARQILQGLFVICIAMACVAASAPAATLDDCGGLVCNSIPDTCTYVSDQPAYKGWGSVVHPGCRPIRWGGTYDHYTAWRWSGSSWSAVTVTEGGRWYIWPFGGGWSWVWKQEYGWVAIKSENVLIDRVFYTCPACTVFN